MVLAVDMVEIQARLCVVPGYVFYLFCIFTSQMPLLSIMVQILSAACVNNCSNNTLCKHLP